MKRYFTKDNRIFLFISLAFLVFSLILAAKQVLDNDEIYSLHTSSKGIGYAFKEALAFESQAPMYFVFLNIWRVLGHSVFLARVLSVLCVFISLFLFKTFSKRYTSNLNSNLATAFYAFNPYTMWLALEIRCYALVNLLTLILLVYFYHVYYTPQAKSYLHRLGFALIAVVGVYTQYFIAFVLLGLALVLLSNRKWKPFLHYILDMMIPLAFLMLMVVVIPEQFKAHTNWVQIPTGVKDYLSYILSLLGDFFLTFNPLGHSQNLGFILIACGIVSVLLYTFIKKGQYQKVKNTLVNQPLFLFLVFLFLVYIFLFRCLGRELLTNKHWAIVHATLFLLFLDVIHSYLNPKVFTWFVVIMVVFYFFRTMMTYNRFRLEYIVQVAEYIEKRESANQPILVYHNETAELFSYFYKGKNIVRPLPVPINYEGKYLDSTWIYTKEEQIANSLKATAYLKANSLWFFYIADFKVLGLDFHSDLVEGYIRRQKIIDEVEVRNIKIFNIAYPPK
jgi:uncharacterized membrane protein